MRQGEGVFLSVWQGVLFGIVEQLFVFHCFFVIGLEQELKMVVWEWGGNTEDGIHASRSWGLVHSVLTVFLGGKAETGLEISENLLHAKLQQS